MASRSADGGTVLNVNQNGIKHEGDQFTADLGPAAPEAFCGGWPDAVAELQDAGFSPALAAECVHNANGDVKTATREALSHVDKKAQLLIESHTNQIECTDNLWALILHMTASPRWLRMSACVSSNFALIAQTVCFVIPCNRALKLCARRNHSGAVHNGAVYTTGSAAFGKLGHGDDSVHCHTPTQIVFGLSAASVTQISANDCHCAAITSDGRLWMWGGGRFGKLGLGDTNPRHQPTLNENGLLKGCVIVQVSCGKAHTACINADGALFTWGEGGGTQFHKLGTTEIAEDVLSPARVTRLEHTLVTNVSAADAHSVISTIDNEIYTCGTAKHHKLGHGTEEKHQAFPTRVEMRRDCELKLGASIVLVEAGHYNSAFVTAAGELWVWGGNSFGNLGLGTNESKCPRPTLVQGALEGKAVSRVSLGKTHSACVTSNGKNGKHAGELYTCGGATDVEEFSKLGQPESTGFGRNFPVLSWTYVGGVASDLMCTQARCGDTHTIIATSDKRVMTFGIYLLLHTVA